MSRFQVVATRFTIFKHSFYTTTTLKCFDSSSETIKVSQQIPTRWFYLAPIFTFVISVLNCTFQNLSVLWLEYQAERMILQVLVQASLTVDLASKVAEYMSLAFDAKQSRCSYCEASLPISHYEIHGLLRLRFDIL